jgi:hypothetical protein
MYVPTVNKHMRAGVKNGIFSAQCISIRIKKLQTLGDLHSIGNLNGEVATA